jgi:hypothetical protein
MDVTWLIEALRDRHYGGIACFMTSYVGAKPENQPQEGINLFFMVYSIQAHRK